MYTNSVLLKINPLVLFREITRIYCENYTKHINALCDKIQLLNVTVGGVYSYHCVLKSLDSLS